MAIRHVVLRGYGNGSSDTSIRKVSLRGYGNGYVTITSSGTLDDVGGKMRQSAAIAGAIGGLLLALGVGISFL